MPARLSPVLATVLATAWMLATALGLRLLIDVGHISYEKSDFGSFLGYGRSPDWPYYDLNPPTFQVLVAPFRLLPLSVAFWAWTAISLSALIYCLWRIDRRLTYSQAIGLACWVPCVNIWIYGQVTWVLLFFVTSAWLARSERNAGFWLAPAIALKPPLALVAVALPWRVALWAGVGSAGLSLLALIFTGPQPWAEWWSLRSAVTWIAMPWNLSVVGAVARLTGATTVTSLGLSEWAAVLAVVSIAFLWVSRRQDHDRRWLYAIWFSLLASPAGWIYYLPLALGPMLRTWTINRWTLPALVWFAVPLVVTLTLRVQSAPYRVIEPWFFAIPFWMLWRGWR